MKKIFISYCHKDDGWKKRLNKHLNVLQWEKVYSVWDDREIEWGEKWFPAIETALNEADAALLLVSADFLNSPFIRLL